MLLQLLLLTQWLLPPATDAHPAIPSPTTPAAPSRAAPHQANSKSITPAPTPTHALAIFDERLSRLSARSMDYPGCTFERHPGPSSPLSHTVTPTSPDPDSEGGIPPDEAPVEQLQHKSKEIITVVTIRYIPLPQQEPEHGQSSSLRRSSKTAASDTSISKREASNRGKQSRLHAWESIHSRRHGGIISSHNGRRTRPVQPTIFNT
ncbi:hypothetical protein B0J18DRAFT_441343 [Chaetomium sp. MPI-SDFR-AT-0129]|nr:hypothetical protein B0J18DRAFT_441343 [Chaetomium sp. MPI-SDFR-AT-0129]